MPDLSSPSFIPKQNPAKNTRRAASRQVYLLTLVSYLLIISALIATVALFAYDRYTQQVLADEIESLNKAIADFDEKDMETVIDLNERLSAADQLLDMNISLRALLAIIEESTIDTVQFESLTFRRDDAASIVLDATISTDSFDSVLFQREMYEKARKLKAVSLDDVTITLASTDPTVVGTRSTVSFTALFTINPDEVLYIPEGVSGRATTTTSSTPASVSAVGTTTVSSPLATTTP